MFEYFRKTETNTEFDNYSQTKPNVLGKINCGAQHIHLDSIS